MRPIIIRVQPCKSHGLETWRVYVNGTYLSEFMSEPAAQRKASDLLRAWELIAQ